jgi:hypothetical protein
VDVGAHPVTGRRRQKSKSGFATKKEAESALREFIRLGEFLVRWLGYQRARGVRSLTLETYEGYIRREIAPVIGGLEIATIRPGHVRSVLARMQKRGLSAATIAQARGVLGSALRQAVEEGLIPTNRVTAVKRPRIRRRELHWPTPEQLTTLLHASMGTMWENPSTSEHGDWSTPLGDPRPCLAGRGPEVGNDPNLPGCPTDARSRPGRPDRVHGAQDQTGSPGDPAARLCPRAHPHLSPRAARAAHAARSAVAGSAR